TTHVAMVGISAATRLRCRRGESNPQALTGGSPWNCCVYRFTTSARQVDSRNRVDLSSDVFSIVADRNPRFATSAQASERRGLRRRLLEALRLHPFRI